MRGAHVAQGVLAVGSVLALALGAEGRPARERSPRVAPLADVSATWSGDRAPRVRASGPRRRLVGTRPTSVTRGGAAPPLLELDTTDPWRGEPIAVAPRTIGLLAIDTRDPWNDTPTELPAPRREMPDEHPYDAPGSTMPEDHPYDPPGAARTAHDAVASADDPVQGAARGRRSPRGMSDEDPFR